MLLRRFMTVLIAAPFLVFSIVYPSPLAFQAVVALCVFLAFLEFFRMTQMRGREMVVGLSLGMVHHFFVLFCPKAEVFFLAETTAVVLILFGSYLLFVRGTAEMKVRKMGLSLLGFIYVGTFGAFVGLIRELPNGIYWVFTLLATTWLNDTFAYFFGHRYGRRRLAPNVSPGKTVEGFLGGFLGSLCGFVLFWLIFSQPITLGQGLILVVVVGLVGPLGDLSESLIKRGFGMKDSGQMIPGHGGMLDRIDALLFTGPVVYWMIRWWIIP